MAQMNMIEAIRSALDVVMDKDPSVIVLGQDVGYFGGVFRCTDGLQRKYGESRVIDAPIAEGGIIGTAIGMGVNGLRPVAEIQFADYIYPGFDQIVSELARLRHRSCGDFFSPVTIRTPCGGGIRGGQTHSQSPEAIFAHISGIKTIPSSLTIPLFSSNRSVFITGRSTVIRRGRRFPGHRIRKAKFRKVTTRFRLARPKSFSPGKSLRS